MRRLLDRIQSAFARFGSEKGVAAIEAAIVLPVFFLLTLGMIQFGSVFNNQIVLANAAAAGGLQAAISRGDPTPLTDITNAVNLAATGLNSANLTIYVCVPTTGANPSCSSTSTATQAAFSSSQGQQVTVTLQYQCSPLFSLQWASVNLSGLCPLSASVTAMVQ